MPANVSYTGQKARTKPATKSMKKTPKKKQRKGRI